MKVRNYEKKSLIITVCIIFFILIIVFLFFLWKYKIYKYTKLTGIVLDNKRVILVVSTKERKLIYKNKFFYLNTQKIKYDILEDKGVIINKDNNKYYELIVKVKLNDKYKFNDSIIFTIKSFKIRLIEMFKIIWEGD